MVKKDANTVIQSGPEAIRRGVELLAAGRLVAFATETVYGLGADATNPAAVERIYSVKGRPANNPLIIHVLDSAAASQFCDRFSATAEALTRYFWPGPLTLVLPCRRKADAGVCAAALAYGSTIALRSPAHPVARELLVGLGRPIAAPSANLSGHTSPTTAEHVAAELSGLIELILDGGECVVGLESTVLDLTTESPIILRPGAITDEMLAPLLGVKPEYAGEAGLPVGAGATETLKSPGMLSRHYAPRTKALRYRRDQAASVSQWLVARPDLRTAQLAPASSVRFRGVAAHLAMATEPVQYARDLYGKLRDADACNAEYILIEIPPEERGLWAAIHDRLTRATEPWSPEVR